MTSIFSGRCSRPWMLLPAANIVHSQKEAPGTLTQETILVHRPPSSTPTLKFEQVTMIATLVCSGTSMALFEGPVNSKL